MERASTSDVLPRPEVLDRLGATCLGDARTQFRVWAPHSDHVEVHITSPHDRLIAMQRDDDGYHVIVADDVQPGARYLYRLGNGNERPDPASRFQPDGVHAASQVVDDDFEWSDQNWRGLPLDEYVTYELHVGTCTPEGTFAAIEKKLDELRDLGVTAIELMPIAQFPGARNWGYDGVLPYAVQNSYGTPRDLKHLVDACHARGLAVVLDVVYNHLGPEGNYLREFGPYFTDRYKTAWGSALNFDREESDHVRRYFIENAIRWIEEFHVDALRVDAVHAIVDHSATPFLQELATAVTRWRAAHDRLVWTFAESDLNDPKILRAPESGGWGLDAQWNDDFHHALHAILTGECGGYYSSFGRIGDLAKAIEERFTYSGQYSRYRKRRYGAPATDIEHSRFVVCTQNHDQTGNRMHGERLASLVSQDQLKVAAATVILSPFSPLFFMGEEYGETAPFLYFTSHSDLDLVEAVRCGRKEEFKRFAWDAEPPDPHDVATFEASKLRGATSAEGERLRDFYRLLLRFRREVLLPMRRRGGTDVRASAFEEERFLTMIETSGSESIATILHFGDRERTFDAALPRGTWRVAIATGTQQAGEVISPNGLVMAPHSVLVLRRA